ncbi:MAG TPA: 16S rRNA (cytosine(1402)-N(4))-methyltransferase RsmH [Bacteroidales bacterium]|nr:16S rRNA (cytosine(1402)-N(4))-methyltransferase RsmH [Bacteroidales bacterium]HRX96798.1 16S rRNA (cytosine(1402)-N(4))-methyltransferase RsmH [Bacteroidales bacterium]
MYHQPVLLNESIEALNIKGDGIYVDVTYGGGGHSAKILEKITTGSLIAFDQDQDALANKPDDDRLILINQNFRFMRNFLKLYKAVPVDGILADLGISSHQIDKAERGFSVRFEAELDLRMNQRKDLTAAKVVNTYSVAKLREIFFRYGDLKNAGRISTLIETARSQSEIKTTGQLKDILKSLAPRMQENKFYAKVFQALRIEVNDEMGALEEMLEQTADLLKPGGRLVVISYHSLEDRLVKNLMKTGNVEGKVHKDFFGNMETPFEVITRKPIIPTDKEIETNNRARSAKLRVAEKINGKG